MSYQIPQQLEYKEKIMFGLTFKQLMYAFVFGLTGILFYKTITNPYAKYSLIFTSSMLGIGFMFLSFDKLLKNYVIFFKNRKLTKDSIKLQQFLGIKNVEEKCIILSTNKKVSVLKVQPINFSIKPDNEKEAIMASFQRFLNSLDFSCQISIQSRRLNITGYLDMLSEIEKKEQNELLRIQISEYKKFVGQTMNQGDVMQKVFYVVVPFTISEIIGNENVKRYSPISTITEEIFQRAKTQLFQRLEFVALGLRSCGLQAVPLNTLEVIELLWGVYHQSEAERGYYPDIPSELIDFQRPQE